MQTKIYTVREVANKLNLHEKHVRQLVSTGQLKPCNPTHKPITFSHSEVERYSKQLQAKRLESLKIIARASEELGLYDDDVLDTNLGEAGDDEQKIENGVETDEQYSSRIRAEAREKILKRSKPLDSKSLLRSMQIEEPTHLGNLSKRPIQDD